MGFILSPNPEPTKGLERIGLIRRPSPKVERPGQRGRLRIMPLNLSQSVAMLKAVAERYSKYNGDNLSSNLLIPRLAC